MTLGKIKKKSIHISSIRVHSMFFEDRALDEKFMYIPRDDYQNNAFVVKIIG